jgi:DNA-binding transcriptional ArsR family regulator
MEAVLRAVADESRRTLLETLARGPATAGELAALLPIARPKKLRSLRRTNHWATFDLALSPYN